MTCNHQQDNAAPVAITNCSPKARAGIALQKNMYTAGAKILRAHAMRPRVRHRGQFDAMLHAHAQRPAPRHATCQMSKNQRKLHQHVMPHCSMSQWMCCCASTSHCAPVVGVPSLHPIILVPPQAAPDVFGHTRLQLVPLGTPPPAGLCEVGPRLTHGCSKPHTPGRYNATRCGRLLHRGSDCISKPQAVGTSMQWPQPGSAPAYPRCADFRPV